MSLISRLFFWKKNVPSIAVIRLNGIIAPSGSPIRKGLNIENVEPLLKKAFKISKIKAVALIINSPGGSPVQSQLIGEKIRLLSIKHNVPVLSFCEDVAASGGYWLAASADEIFAEKSSIIGSIGVISSGFGFANAIEKLGIERRIYTSGKSKSMLDPFIESKENDVKHLKTLQNEIHENFISYIKDRRGSKLSSDEEEIFNGKFWTGIKAHELGLVDGLGSINKILKDRFGEDYKTIVISQKKSFFSLGGNLIEIIVGKVLSIIEERIIWSKFNL